MRGHVPGTGKTTVARRVGQLFQSLGLLASAEVVACSASDFVTGYANQVGESDDVWTHVCMLGRLACGCPPA